MLRVAATSGLKFHLLSWCAVRLVHCSCGNGHMRSSVFEVWVLGTCARKVYVARRRVARRASPWSMYSLYSRYNATSIIPNHNHVESIHTEYMGLQCVQVTVLFVYVCGRCALQSTPKQVDIALRLSCQCITTRGSMDDMRVDYL